MSTNDKENKEEEVVALIVAKKTKKLETAAKSTKTLDGNCSTQSVGM